MRPETTIPSQEMRVINETCVLTLLRRSTRANEFRTPATIATELGLSVEIVHRALRSLEAAGLVWRVGRDPDMWAPT
jgi:DNA-binding MarR family transcriptional regulator